MASRRSNWLGAWFDLARTTARASQRLGKTAVKQATRQAAKHAPPLQKTAKWILSGVATPAAPPATRGGGRWEEGLWGLGPLHMRRYRLFLPPGIGARRPMPLLLLLHGCGQDAASFAAATRAAAGARAGRYAVLLPEQSSAANPQRCWNWFRPEAVVAAEAALLMAMVDHVCARHPLRRDRLFALGLSAGGAMAMTLALRYSDRFLAVGTHSGAVPHSAVTPVQAGQAMRGRRGPALAGLRRHLAGRALPPLLVIHGELDRSVAPANADASAELWRALAEGAPLVSKAPRQSQRGTRHPYTTTDWQRGGAIYVRQVRIAGLGHAWSGGTARQAFSDPKGPDALKLAWGFFSRWLD
jgi:poly(hydroxyalkanoate) depolymerase family esterase